MESYRTPRTTAQSESVIKKSRFIGQIAPAQTEDEARAFLASVQKAHPDARHHVFAYNLRQGNIQRFSDDGEPQGTGGKPTLEVITREELTNCIIVVTRYFGGTLLGAGGLLRAYAGGASGAVKAADIVTMGQAQELSLTVDYPLFDPLQNLFQNYPIKALDTQFTQQVDITFTLAADRVEELTAAIAELTDGRCRPAVTGERFTEI